jgi:hypothetical protein
MGGFGSGRPSGTWRNTVEACPSIDVNRLHTAGYLFPGWRSGLQWMRDGEKVASIGLRCEVDRLHLSYRVRTCTGEWEDVAETVRIVHVPCRFDGERPYFICPAMRNGVPCGRRVAKLYGRGRDFLCRCCHRLTYACQREDECSRAVRKAKKIRGRIEAESDMRSSPVKNPCRGIFQAN